MYDEHRIWEYQMIYQRSLGIYGRLVTVWVVIDKVASLLAVK